MAKKLLGDLLIEKGLVTEAQVKEALRVQACSNRRLGSLLIKMKLVTEEQLLESLVSQGDIALVDIPSSVESNVKKIMPRYFCSKYGVLPLAISENNLLEVVMVDPSDSEAVRAVEDYTGYVVDPGLARERDVLKAIQKQIPFSLKDIFNPQAMNGFSKIVSVMALVAIIMVGYLSFRYVQIEKYGTISDLPNEVLYKNHDIMINRNKKTGALTLLGHGAYAQGLYSVSFKTKQSLTGFVEKKRKDFSTDQYAWLEWVLEEGVVQ